MNQGHRLLDEQQKYPRCKLGPPAFSTAPESDVNVALARLPQCDIFDQRRAMRFRSRDPHSCRSEATPSDMPSQGSVDVKDYASRCA